MLLNAGLAISIPRSLPRRHLSAARNGPKCSFMRRVSGASLLLIAAIDSDADA
jgi:hypothetical protein